jgi:hypothetical protein
MSALETVPKPDNGVPELFTRPNDRKKLASVAKSKTKLSRKAEDQTGGG